MALGPGPKGEKTDELNAILNYLQGGRLEVASGPPLMTAGILLAIVAYLLAPGVSLRSLALALVGLTVTMLGATMEFAYLLVISKAADLATGLTGGTDAKRVVLISALIGSYVVLIGMPLLAIYLVRLARRAGVPEGEIPGGSIAWVYFLATLGLAASFVQPALARSLASVLVRPAQGWEGPPQPLGSQGQ